MQPQYFTIKQQLYVEAHIQNKFFEINANIYLCLY